ncbi:MAG: hypothetical protein IPM24_14105 [Bryobacterales bacterium]|nr:hypothetical protein [Bryobacterales bacterium]
MDSNGWLVYLERVLAPESEVWVDCEMPAALPRTAPRHLALVEAAMYGGRWPVTLPDDLAEGLARGESAALDVWRKMAEAARFFAQHADWPGFEPVAALGVVSNFSGPSRFLTREVLNLTSRLHQPFRIADASKLTEPWLAGLAAVVFPDAAAPGESLRKLLTAFAESGGLLVVGARWGEARDEESPPHPRYAVRKLGRGRIAVARRAMNDPYLVANDVRVLLSSRHDPVRFWNGGSLGSFYTRAPEGPAVVQIVNYATHPDRYPPSLRVAGDFRTAKLWTIGADAQPLEVRRERGGAEILLPPVEVYCAVELR